MDRAEVRQSPGNQLVAAKIHEVKARLLGVIQREGMALERERAAVYTVNLLLREVMKIIGEEVRAEKYGKTKVIDE
jgi:hypothetical protein